MPRSQHKHGRVVRVWQLGLAVVAIGLILRVGLGAWPTNTEPDEAEPAKPAAPVVAQADPVEGASPAPVAVLPFDLQGEVPGPLLTAILQQFVPDSTADHADALRDTLPPGEDPRMIVIIPEDDGAMF